MSSTVLIFLFLLFAKHAIADLAIQRLFPSNKLEYLNKQAHLHYFHHAVGSFLVGFVYDIRLAIVISSLDYLIHWHVDFAKSHVRHHYGWTEKDLQYWFLQSVDQILHYATYVLFAVLVLQFYV